MEASRELCCLTKVKGRQGCQGVLQLKRLPESPVPESRCAWASPPRPVGGWEQLAGSVSCSSGSDGFSQPITGPSASHIAHS